MASERSGYGRKWKRWFAIYPAVEQSPTSSCTSRSSITAEAAAGSMKGERAMSAQPRWEDIEPAARPVVVPGRGALGRIGTLRVSCR